MKKVVTLLLVFTMLLVLLPASALAAESSGTCGENVQWSLSGGKLTISGSGPMYDYYYSKAIPWREEEITSVVVNNGVTSIGDSAFDYCTSLTSITLPDSLTSIGQWAFNNCTSLTSITLPDSVTVVGEGAFVSCTSLMQIGVAPGNASYCSLDGVLMNRDATKLVCCPSAKRGSYAIPTSVTSIGIWAFCGCTSLTNITIPDSVTNIGECAFSDCTSLTSITLPESVTVIGEGAFAPCTSLMQICVAPGNAGYRSLDGVLMNRDATELVCCPGAKRGSYAIPTSVTSIGDWGFYFCGDLTDITIPNSVASIGDWAFCGCTSLTSITIPDSVTDIGEGALCDCTSLTSISIPNSVASIGDWAFCGCTSLTSITIPDSVTDIGEGAFCDCTSLTSITIPDSVTVIGYDAFEDCDRLTIYGYRGTERKYPPVYMTFHLFPWIWALRTWWRANSIIPRFCGR